MCMKLRCSSCWMRPNIHHEATGGGHIFIHSFFILHSFIRLFILPFLPQRTSIIRLLLFIITAIKYLLRKQSRPIIFVIGWYKMGKDGGFLTPKAIGNRIKVKMQCCAFRFLENCSPQFFFGLFCALFWTVKRTSKAPLVLPDVSETMSWREWNEVSHEKRRPFEGDASIRW